MRKPLSLRRLRHARNRPPQNGKPTPHPAHTAGGRDISGLWEWFERIVLMATLISIGLGTWAYWEERETRRDEAIARAWSLLTTPATGNSGKREALEYLAGQGVSLRGIDLSCAKMGGGWDAEKKECGTPVYLEGLTLKAPDGQRVDLRGAHLEGANLRGAHLEGVNLRETHLQGADLWEAHLEGADLWDAHLEGADLRMAHLEGANFWEAHLEEADLSRAHLKRADLRRANLGGAHLEEAHLDGADLKGAYLKEALLRETHLEGADLTGAHLVEANLFGARLVRADLVRAHLERAFLRRVRLEGTNLIGAHLEGANLLQAHLEGAHLSAANFTDAKNVDSADFTNTWAWADQPPKGLPATIAVALCQHQDGMDRSIRPKPCLPPG